MTDHKLIAGRYVLGSAFAEGEHGRVYQAIDHITAQEVAIKVLKVPRAERSIAIERLEREAKILKSLNHSSIVRCIDVGFERTLGVYLVTEWLQGETLRARLAQHALTWAEISPWFGGVCEGIAQAHQQGIAHRDLKPDNVILLNDTHAKVLDFGLSIATGMDALTRSGEWIGTPQYMAPEAFQRSYIDEPARLDVYALGLILWESLAGHSPFDGLVGSDFLRLLIGGIASRLDDMALWKGPMQVRAVIARAVDKDPAQRYANAGEFWAALMQV